MTIAISVPQRKMRDGQRDFVTNTSSATTGYTSTKQSQANHGGPKIARTARRKSVRVFSQGMNNHITLQITAIAMTSDLRRGWMRMSCEIVRKFNAPKIAMEIRTK